MDLDYTPIARPREVRLDNARICRAHRQPAQVKLNKLIERGLNGDASGSVLTRRVADAVGEMQAEAFANCVDPDDAKEGLRELLRALDSSESPILDNDQALAAVGLVAAHFVSWVNRPETFDASGADADPIWKLRPARGSILSPASSVRRHLHALLQHMLCSFPLPPPFDSAWLQDEDEDKRFAQRGRRWFLHVARGGNLRHAEDLPYPLTKAMAHHVLLAPYTLMLIPALRYGQFAGLGVRPDLAEALARTRLSSPCGDEEFALSVGHFLRNNESSYAPPQVGPMLDFVMARRFGSERMTATPSYRLTGRTAADVGREMNQWHRELARARNVTSLNLHWLPCALGDFEHRIEHPAPFADQPPEVKVWRFVELLSAAELHEEGAAMRHCVASYALLAKNGHCAIYSMQVGEGLVVDRRRATIEVSIRSSTIVQARGERNAPLPAQEAKVLRAWAGAKGLAIAPQVLLS